MTHARRPPAVLDRPARAIVGGVRLLYRYRLAVSAVGLVLVLLLGGGYLMLGSLKIDPLQSHYQVRVELAESGGLLPNQDVTLRGVRIGRVTSVDVAGDKVVAVASIDGDVRIPASGTVKVAALSAAGEQYLDFVPATDSGPYLSNGSLVSSDRTSSPTTLADMLGDLNGPLAQIDPAKLHAIMTELGVSSAGPRKLAEIIDGGTFLISTLYSVLPQTVSLLRNSRMVLLTAGDVSPGLRATSDDLASLFGGVSSMTGGFQQLVARAPGTLTIVDKIIADNSPTMVALLGNLVTVAQMSYVHIPALREFFFPQQRAGSTLDSIISAMHDNKVWALANIYPAVQCDYDVPRRPGTVPDFPEPYLYSHCTNPDPSLLVRGARNAPHPPGDDPEGVPPGADPLAKSDPTPVGRYTFPTPYGGAHVPTYIPHK
jgi:virulence factor Mce-like protein